MASFKGTKGARRGCHEAAKRGVADEKGVGSFLLVPAAGLCSRVHFSQELSLSLFLSREIRNKSFFVDSIDSPLRSSSSSRSFLRVSPFLVLFRTFRRKRRKVACNSFRILV